jgi:predicted dehydrogenase
MTLKVAIVGMGNIGNRHAQVYVKRDDVEIVAVCDIIPEKADRAAQQYGAKAFYSIQEMLNSGIQIDAASMCTAGTENGGDHYQATMELLEGGIPTLGEKPISNNTEEADEMVALAKKKGIRYGVNLNHRFTPAALKVKEWINEGRLGSLNMIMMRMWINNPNESSPWFHARALHPHSIDILRYYGGDIARVQAFFKKARGARSGRTCRHRSSLRTASSATWSAVMMPAAAMGWNNWRLSVPKAVLSCWMRASISPITRAIPGKPKPMITSAV